MTSLNDNAVVVVAFIFALLVGSFLNVLIHRLPLGISIVKPRSRCPQCGRQIRWYDNVPLLSYLLLGGRCRDCHAPIPLMYPAVELLSGLFGAFSVWRHGLSLEAAWIYAFLAVLLTIACIDWRHQIIPDVLSIGGAVLGVVGAFVCLPIDPADSVIGAVVGAGLLAGIAALYKVIRKVDGLGGGDIKLMAMIGAFLGWQLVFPVLFLASFLGSLYGLHLIRSGGNGRTAVAFGSFLAPSAAVIFFVGRQFLRIYMGFFRG
jgi:leader peptidase (prepilin peptidase)/N-methyltransferase